MSSYQDYANAVSDILEKKGSAQARATEQGGQLWGSTIANLGQVIPQQVQQAIAQNAAKRKTAQIQSIVQKYGGDIAKAGPEIMQVDPTIGSDLIGKWSKVQETLSQAQEIDAKAQQARQDLSDKTLMKVNDPDSYAHWVILEQKLGNQRPTNYDPAYVSQQKVAIQSAKPPIKLSKDEELLDATTYKPIASNIINTTPKTLTELQMDAADPTSPTREKSQTILKGMPSAKTSEFKTVTELRIDAANPNSPTQAQSAEILKNMPASETVSGPAEDERYRVIIAKPPQARTPDERAWAAAYEKQKTLGIDTSASFAAQRQAESIAAQVAQQGRGQKFTEQQAGRDRLDKVNQAYHTAQSGVDTLRETIQAAQAGNVTAGAMQSLLTTMATLKAEGFNRINTAEIGSTKDAGSLVQNIEGWFGKATAGQPIPASVQKDMADYASILEKAAASKYLKDFNSVKQTYGLTEAIPEAVPTGGRSVTTAAKEGDTKPIPGYPGTEQTYRNGKWIRTK